MKHKQTLLQRINKILDFNYKNENNRKKNGY